MPYAALNAVEQELQRLENLGIIEPITYLKWAAPIAIIRKANGTIQLCADFSTGFNAALAPYQYPLSVPECLFRETERGQICRKIESSRSLPTYPCGS